MLISLMDEVKMLLILKRSYTLTGISQIGLPLFDFYIDYDCISHISVPSHPSPLCPTPQSPSLISWQLVGRHH